MCSDTTLYPLEFARRYTYTLVHIIWTSHVKSSCFHKTLYPLEFTQRHILLVHTTSYVHSRSAQSHSLSISHVISSCFLKTLYPLDFTQRHILLITQRHILLTSYVMSSCFHKTSYPLKFTQRHNILLFCKTSYSFDFSRHASCFHTIDTFLYTNFVLCLPYKSLHA